MATGDNTSLLATIELFQTAGFVLAAVGFFALFLFVLSFARRWRTLFILVSTAMAVIDASILLDALLSLVPTSWAIPRSSSSAEVIVVLVAQLVVARHAWRLPRDETVADEVRSSGLIS